MALFVCILIHIQDRANGLLVCILIHIKDRANGIICLYSYSY